jgi:hypothetical protein
MIIMVERHTYYKKHKAKYYKGYKGKQKNNWTKTRKP